MAGWRHESTIPERFRARAAGWDAALRAGLRTLVSKVERAATRNLSGPGGSGNPGAYPVPRRFGTLARGMYSAVRGRVAEVGNRARNPRTGEPYARAVHEGFRAFGNPRAPYYGRRPYLEDAAASVDPMAELSAALERVLPA